MMHKKLVIPIASFISHSLKILLKRNIMPSRGQRFESLKPQYDFWGDPLRSTNEYYIEDIKKK